ARAGVDLHHMLWVRPHTMQDGLKCTELLLQAGGFALVAFDLGAILPRSLRSHAWPRLLHAAERSHTAAGVLALHRVAGSCAVLSLQLRSCRPCWQPGAWPLFDGFTTSVFLERNKLGAPGRTIVIRVRDSCSVESSELRVENANRLISLNSELSTLNS